MGRVDLVALIVHQSVFILERETRSHTGWHVFLDNKGLQHRGMNYADNTSIRCQKDSFIHPYWINWTYKNMEYCQVLRITAGHIKYNSRYCLMSVYEICFKGDICFSNLLSLRSTGLVPLDLFQQSFNNKDLKIIMLNWLCAHRCGTIIPTCLSAMCCVYKFPHYIPLITKGQEKQEQMTHHLIT